MFRIKLGATTNAGIGNRGRGFGKASFMTTDSDTKPARRMGPEDSEMRVRFIDAVEELLCDEGYHAVSARKVAAKAELKPQLLYYYFRTIDDLILELVRRHRTRRKALFKQAMASADPLTALWTLARDPTGAAMSAELTSMANHREPIREEIVRATRELRALQIEAVSKLLEQRGASSEAYPAAGIVMIAVAVARTITLETTLGISEGHDAALEIIEGELAKLSALTPSSI